MDPHVSRGEAAKSLQRFSETSKILKIKGVSILFSRGEAANIYIDFRISKKYLKKKLTSVKKVHMRRNSGAWM